jgi:tripartite-type tricarboxylate transporter receptor subunit TctC
VTAAVLGISGLVATACGTEAGGGGGGSASGSEVSYPEKRIEMVVPYPAGGATDSLARVWSKCLEDELGQTVTVANREGGQGGVGSAFVADAEPNGYTLEIGPESPLVVLPQVVTDVGYGYKDFDFIAQLGNSPDVIYVRKDSEFKTIDDLVAALKSGGDVPVAASYAPSSTTRMRADSMAAKNNFPWEIVPFNSAADVAQAVVAGDADFAYSGTSIPMFEQLTAGNVRILAAGEDVSLMQDDVPTWEEAGLKAFDGPNADLVYLAGPAGMPDEVVGVLEDAVTACRDTDAVSEALPVQFLPDEGTSGDALDETIPEIDKAYRDHFAQTGG